VASAATPEEAIVLDYLIALDEGRYDDAALLLGQGGLEWTGRRDLRPLLDDSGSLPDLADALRGWCDAGALCQRPTALRTDGNVVVATFVVDGTSRSSTFVGGTFEGSPLVIGLPLQLPVGEALADTVECPTDNVGGTWLGDLDGDGWTEVLTLRRPEGASADVLSACGTTLSMQPLSVPPAEGFRQVYALDVEGDGASEVMIGVFTDGVLDPAATIPPGQPELAGGLTAEIFRYDSGRLAPTGQIVHQSPPIGGLVGTSFGCVDLDDDGTRDLVHYDYSYVGGSDLSNSTALEFTATLVEPDGSTGLTQSSTHPLPAEIEAAFRVIGGYCGPVQVQTG
jgi:hypothetical protein